MRRTLVNATLAATVVASSLGLSRVAKADPSLFCADAYCWSPDGKRGPITINFVNFVIQLENAAGVLVSPLTLANQPTVYARHVIATAELTNTTPVTLQGVKIAVPFMWDRDISEKWTGVPIFTTQAYNNATQRWNGLNTLGQATFNYYTPAGNGGMYYRSLDDTDLVSPYNENGTNPFLQLASATFTDQYPTWDVGDMAPGQTFQFPLSMLNSFNYTNHNGANVNFGGFTGEFFALTTSPACEWNYGIDTDGDDVPDSFDLDGDGVDDPPPDANGNGIPDGCDPCGNGALDAGEQCDDGNVVNGDGCNASCQNECADTDGDGLCDAVDDCPLVPNGNQLDGDADGVGDVCDNCPVTFNPSQLDGDADGAGNACDLTCINNVPAVADTWVASGTPNTPNGASTVLWMGPGMGDTRMSLVRFNLAPLPAGARFESGSLTMRQFSITGGVARTVSASLVGAAWNDTTVTWNTKPAVGALLGSGPNGGPGVAWVTINLGAPRPFSDFNNGIYLTQAIDATRAYSREGNGGASPPRISFCYTVPE